MEGNPKDRKGSVSPIGKIPPLDIRRSLFSSFNVQSVAVLLRVAQQIVLVPTLISGWGSAVYQDWILVFSAAGLFSMLDFGSQNYFGNALVIAWSKEDHAGYRRTFTTAMTVYAVIALAAVLVLLGSTAALSWPVALGTRTMSASGVTWSLVFLVSATISLIPLGVVGAIYRVHGDYLHGTILIVTAEAVRGFGICLVALAGFGPVTAAAFNLAVSGLLWLFMIADIRRRFGPVPFALDWPRLAELKTAAIRSALYFVPSVATPTVLTLPILLLGRMAPNGDAVLAYSVTRTLTGFVRQFVAQICQPIGSELARRQALADSEKLRRLFRAGGRLTSGMAGVMSGLTFVLAGPFLRIWTHGAVAFDPLLIGAFLATVTLLAPAQVAMVLFLSNNKPLILVAGHGGYAIGTVIFCALLIHGYSAVGAAVATGLAEFLFIGLLVTRAAAQEIGVRLGHYLGRCHLVSLAGFLLSYGVAWAIERLCAAGSLTSLAAIGLLWAALMAAPSFYLLLTGEERRWVADHLLSLVARFRKA